MPSLKELLNSWAQRIGAPQSQGAVLYSLPQMPSGETEAKKTITAPNDGFIQLHVWSVIGGIVFNKSVKYHGENRYLSNGCYQWGATNWGNVNAWVPCSKGDEIEIQIDTVEGNAPSGNVVFFPRIGSS